MSRLFRLSGAVDRDPGIDAWFSGVVDGSRAEPADELRRIAWTWFDQMRGCGADVRELLHDRCPVVCVEDAPFGQVGAFRNHVNLGFFHGAALDDPAGLLQGEGKRMRHVKLRWGEPVDATALKALVAAAYRDIRLRLRTAS